MTSSSKVTIYNNSESTFQVNDGGKDKFGRPLIVNIPPKSAISLNKKEAERLLENYPKHFIEGGSVKDQAKSIKEKDQKIVELETKLQSIEEGGIDGKGHPEDRQPKIDELNKKLEESEENYNSIVEANKVGMDNLHKVITDLQAKLDLSEAAKEIAENEVKGLNELIDSAQAEAKNPTQENKSGNKQT